jgi:plasmid stabilization system protein ParE
VSRYVLSLGAHADLQAIWDYIAADNIAAADSWNETLHRAFEVIAASPALGHRRADLTSSPVLFWPVENYLIVYQVGPRSIEIVAVTHGARDIPTLLWRRTR